jgi:acetyltransferase-like isoleucine patch superfamily enzyme
MKEIEKSQIIRDKLVQSQSSPLKMYKTLTVGDVSFSKFIYYEIVTFLFGSLSGGLGYFLRKKFYPRLFKKAGKGLIIGKNVVFRNPSKIELGDYVTIDDNTLLDGRGDGDKGIEIEDNVLIGRNCLVLAKTGPIHLNKRVSIGSNSVIVSLSGVELGEAVLCAGNISISTGLYKIDELEKPIMDQDVYSKGPVVIGKNSWIGTGVIIVDGVTIGDGAVIGASSLVNKDIDNFGIAFGVPAKIAKYRNAIKDD